MYKWHTFKIHYLFRNEKVWKTELKGFFLLNSFSLEQDDILKSRTRILLIHQQWNIMYVSVQSVWRIQHTVVHRVHVISVFCVKKPTYKISKQLTMMLRYILKHSTTFQNKSFVWNILTMYTKRTVNSVKFQFVIIAENRKHKQTDIKAAYKDDNNTKT